MRQPRHAAVLTFFLTIAISSQTAHWQEITCKTFVDNNYLMIMEIVPP